MQPITAIAEKLGLSASDLIPYGTDKAKLPLSLLDRPRARTRPARLVLVSAITPTPAGEGKTTTSIGLAQALDLLGRSVCAALREPSLGPVFGLKGGGTGGGNSRLEPSDDINLHFTGDLHAITAAHNLLAAMIDNHLHFRLEPRLDPRRVLWPRVLDMNDRSLREVIVGIGGPLQGVPRQSSFDITAASEVMAILCLASGPEDLRKRLSRILVGFTEDRAPVTAKQIGAVGAMMALLKDALQPNLVQTTDGTPAIVHGGPFANIAHGCNSVLATRMAMHLADWTITEAGFGFDLGAEKFFDIKCVSAGLDTAAVVLVATIRALKYHGGTELKGLAPPEAVRRGLPNLAKHVESIRHFDERPVIALNKFHADTDEEIAVVRDWSREHDLPFAVSDHFARGGEGALDLARAVIEHAEEIEEPFEPIYDWSEPVLTKIQKVANAIYGAKGVVLSKRANMDLRMIERLGASDLPICIAKGQQSLSGDPKHRGRPNGFDIEVRGIVPNLGAGFLVVLTGDLLRMPGLPKRPASFDIDWTPEGGTVGVE